MDFLKTACGAIFVPGKSGFSPAACCSCRLCISASHGMTLAKPADGLRVGLPWVVLTPVFEWNFGHT